MGYKPRDYQKNIIDAIIIRHRLAIFAGMGMGKTSATLCAVSYLRHIEGCGRVLVLAPLRVARTTWPEEVEKWPAFGLSVSVVTGTPAQRRAALDVDADIYTTNYENVPWLVRTCDPWPFDVIVADESTKLKGFRLGTKSKRSRAGHLARVAWTSRRFIELTGTPSPNGLEDLWGQLYFIDRGERLGRSMAAYHDAFFTPHRVGRDAFAVRWDPVQGAQRRIEARLADVCVSIRPEDFFPVDKPVDVTIGVDLPDDARRIYDAVLDDFTACTKDGKIIDAANAAVVSSKLLQIASGAVYTDDGAWSAVHDEKIEALKSIIDEAGGESVLVAYMYRFDAERIMAAVPDAVMLDRDPRTIDAWNAGEIHVLLAHPASAGHGLNLQDGGRILVVFSETWNLEHYMQMIERIGPMRQAQSGHPRTVFVYHIVARGTVDARVMACRGKKKKVQDALLEDLTCPHPSV